MTMLNSDLISNGFILVFAITGGWVLTVKWLSLKHDDRIHRIQGEHSNALAELKRMHVTHTETALCLWEEIWTILGREEDLKISPDDQDIFHKVDACLKCLGYSHLRSLVISWAPRVDADWNRVDDPENTGDHGHYPHAFDWQFIPDWIRTNIDWSDPCHPTVVSKKG